MTAIEFLILAEGSVAPKSELLLKKWFNVLEA